MIHDLLKQFIKYAVYSTYTENFDKMGEIEVIHDKHIDHCFKVSKFLDLEMYFNDFATDKDFYHLPPGVQLNDKEKDKIERYGENIDFIRASPYLQNKTYVLNYKKDSSNEKYVKCDVMIFPWIINDDIEDDFVNKNRTGSRLESYDCHRSFLLSLCLGLCVVV